MTEDEVERVARAIYNSRIPKGGRNYMAFDDLCNNDHHEEYDSVIRDASAAIAAMHSPQDGLQDIAQLRELSEKATKGEWSAAYGVLLGPSGPETDFDPMVIGAFKAGKGLVAGISYAIYSVPTKTEGAANTEFAAACVNFVRSELERRGK